MSSLKFTDDSVYGNILGYREYTYLFIRVYTLHATTNFLAYENLGIHKQMDIS